MGEHFDKVQRPEDKEEYIFHYFEGYDVPVFATSPPSRRLRQVTPVSGNLILLPGGNDLSFSGTGRKPAYQNASVRRSDLRRLIRQLRKMRPQDLR